MDYVDRMMGDRWVHIQTGSVVFWGSQLPADCPMAVPTPYKDAPYLKAFQ